MYRACLEHPEPRPARAGGSTIRIVIADKRSTGDLLRFVFDAETYAGATPALEQEVRRIMDSIVIEGPMAG
jgi:hypothetical protein